MNTIYVRADSQCPPPRQGWRGVARGLLAVAVLLLTAADALVTALAGVPPMAWAARRIRRVIADEYRRAYYDAVDAEILPEDSGTGSDSGREHGDPGPRPGAGLSARPAHPTARKDAR